MDTYETIHQLKELLEKGIISQEEYDEKKMEILFPEEFEVEKIRKKYCFLVHFYIKFPQKWKKVVKSGGGELNIANRRV